MELLRSSGRPISQAASELEINPNSLRTSLTRILGNSGSSAEELLEEINKLQRENEYLRRQCEI